MQQLQRNSYHPPERLYRKPSAYVIVSPNELFKYAVFVTSRPSSQPIYVVFSSFDCLLTGDKNLRIAAYAYAIDTLSGFST